MSDYISERVLEIKITPLESQKNNGYELYKMPLKHKLFKLEGRMGRLNYFLFSFLLNALFYACGILLIQSYIDNDYSLIPVSFLYLFVMCSTLFPIFCVVLKRLHDLNHSAWFLLFLIAVFGIIFSLS